MTTMDRWLQLEKLIYKLMQDPEFKSMAKIHKEELDTNRRKFYALY